MSLDLSSMSAPATQPVGHGPGFIYAPAAIAQVPRLLSMLDREPDSLGYGCFDREFWGWKFRDYPITMLQAAMHPLALLWRCSLPNNRYHGNPALLDWIGAAIDYTCGRQHANGAFDSVGPNTQDHGVTLAMAYTLAETLRALGEELPSQHANSATRAIRRACKFALNSDEDYAFISNHKALFALAYLAAYEISGDRTYREQSERVIQRVLIEQSPDGWYREYGGPDPGYESLGISYLATYWQRTRSAELLASLRRGIEFFAHCVHPDGSVGGVYGSRHTSLYFPAGFEMLAREIPLAASIAGFMRDHLDDGNVLIPATSDAENLPSLMANYLRASLESDNHPATGGPPLPHETVWGVRHFPDAGITVASKSRYYAVVSASKGGVCRVFDKRRKMLAYQDAGYVVDADGHRWATQPIGFGKRLVTESADELTCSTYVGEVRQMLPSPVKFIALRLLNLTLFRSVALGAWIRRRIIERLITRQRRGPIRLRRTLRFGDESIQISDRLQATPATRVSRLELRQSFTSIHMGSANYYISSDLARPAAMDTLGMAAQLDRAGVAERHLVIEFPALTETSVDARASGGTGVAASGGTGVAACPPGQGRVI
jgi:hypothetical protein